MNNTQIDVIRKIAVIPAAINSGAGQAGIHLDLFPPFKSKMDSRFRGNDALERARDKTY